MPRLEFFIFQIAATFDKIDIADDAVIAIMLKPLFEQITGPNTRQYVNH